MSSRNILVLAALVAGCVGPQSTFAFDLTGDLATRVRSGANVRGEVDDAGYLALDDDAYGLKIELGGLGPGSRTLGKGGAGSLVIMSKASGDVFETTGEGTCTVWVDPHESTNGSAISGWFTCTTLGSTSGKVVDVKGGRFTTYLDDAANNPSQTPPAPGV